MVHLEIVDEKSDVRVASQLAQFLHILYKVIAINCVVLHVDSLEATLVGDSSNDCHVATSGAFDCDVCVFTLSTVGQFEMTTPCEQKLISEDDLSSFTHCFVNSTCYFFSSLLVPGL